MNMKIYWFLVAFFLLFTFFSIPQSPVFASQPVEKCVKSHWFTNCFPLPPKIRPTPKPPKPPSPTPSPTPPVIGAALENYKQPHGRNCDIDVPSQFSTIQAAIDVAAPGDTICVGAGTYNEDIFINKSIHLSGKGALKTIINGQGPTWPGAVYVTATNVIVEGFFIRGVGTNVAAQLSGNDLTFASTLRYNWMQAGNGGMALQLDGFQNSTLVQNNILEGNNSPHVARESGGSSGRVDFLNNTFIGSVNPNTRSDTGITLDAGLPDSLIKQNAFKTTGTMIALIIPNGTSIINENNFSSSTTIKVSNGWPTTVNAENNWWGDTDPSDNIQGDVDFTPFAISPFAEY